MTTPTTRATTRPDRVVGALRDLVAFHRTGPQWPTATQSAVAITLPLLAFSLAGHLTFGLTASLGSFLVVHLPDRSRRERAAQLPVIMVGFLVAALAGIATATSLVAGLAAILAVAIASSLLGLALDAGSPGSMFYVLITGAAGSLTAPASLQGAAVDPLLVLAMISLGMLCAYGVVLAPLALPSVRRRDAELFAARPARRFAFTADVERIFVRLTVATVLAVATSATLDLHRVQWVLLAVIAILQKDSEVRLSMLRALHRVVGTAIALVVFYLIALWDPDGIVLVALIGVLMFLFKILQPRNLGLSLVAVTPMALVIAAKGAGQPLIEIVGVRVEDTALGATVAIVVLAAVTATRSLSARHLHARAGQVERRRVG